MALRAIKIVEEEFDKCNSPDHALYGRCWKGLRDAIVERIEQECIEQPDPTDALFEATPEELGEASVAEATKS